jgi:rRNA-processing protein EBP2
MAGRKNASKAKGPITKKPKQLKEKKAQKEEPQEDVGQRLTLEALDAISSDEDSVSGSEADTNMGMDMNMATEAETDPEWDAEARALRQAIKDGAFDNIGVAVDKKDVDVDTGEKVEELDQDEDQDSSQEEEEIDEVQAQRLVSSGIALQAALEELAASDAAALPWVETLAVVPKDPLPFGAAGAEGNPIDVHDDLKREVAFYNLALQGVVDARIKCAQSKIPFSRPDDFFAEMVKTDGKTFIFRFSCHVLYK